MKSVLQAVLALAIMAYPIGVYFGLARIGVVPIACLLAALALARMALVRRERRLRIASSLALVVALAVAVASALTRDSAWLRYYPMLINLTALTVFGWSLLHPPSVIEQLARLHTPQLPAEGVAWTRAVTRVWCAFFVLNGSVAWYTARFATLQTWTLYNGFIAYLLIGLLLGGEFLLRPRGSQHR